MLNVKKPADFFATADKLKIKHKSVQYIFIHNPAGFKYIITRVIF